jgi:hypothetical protein
MVADIIADSRATSPGIRIPLIAEVAELHTLWRSSDRLSTINERRLDGLAAAASVRDERPRF